VPGATPVIIPEASIVATAVASLLHAPPVMASAKVVVSPWHTDEVPVMAPAAGSGLTVTIKVATAVPQPLATV